jgi:DHA2 family methylenomycin A resistance protein-like MFS transporter
MSTLHRSDQPIRARGSAAVPPPWWTLVAVCLGLGMLMIDTFVVNVALPTIARDFDAPLSAVEWTVSGYVLVFGVLPVAMGRLGDIYGRRRLYLLGLLLFIASSVACAAAQGIGQLVVFRVVQGVGAATVMPGTLSILTQAFPPRQRGSAIGVWGGVSGLGLIAGPLLGGLLVYGQNWRWIFLVNLPVGLVALALALRFVPESRDEHTPRSVDWPGLGFLSAGLLLVTLGFTRANDTGWTAPPLLGSFAAGVVLLVMFLLVEHRARHPLVPLSLFRSGTFLAACLSAFLFSAAVFGSQPYLSLFMQNSWGFSPLEAGLAFLPATALVAVLTPVSGALGQRLGRHLRLMVVAGSVCVLASALYLLRLDADSTYLDGLLPAFLLRGLGIGLVSAATSLAVTSAVPLAQSGLASGTLTMARQIGAAVGVAVLGAVYLHHVERELPRRLASRPPVELARLVTAAEHFAAVGTGEVGGLTKAVIVDGVVLTALTAAILCAAAATAAFFIRQRPLDEGVAPLRRGRSRPRGSQCTWNPEQGCGQLVARGIPHRR